MRLILLGSAAGGGYPQWNCACAGCELARSEPSRARPRTQSSIAFTGTGKDWFLIGAGPDIRSQIEACAELRPGPEPRETPIRGVLLTDAELDHTTGLLILREGSPLDIFGTVAVFAALERALPIRTVTEAYRPARWIAVEPNRCFELEDGRLEVTAFVLGYKRPRYTAGHKIDGNWVIGYRIRDTVSGGVTVYAPCIPVWNTALESALAGAHYAFVDGTFWAAAEMTSAGPGHRTAAEIGHLPITGAGGSAERFAAIPGCHIVYVHVNNTNPVLDDHSPEKSSLHAMGFEIGFDGMEVTL